MTLKLNENPTTTRVQTRDGREAVILDYCPGQTFCLIGKMRSLAGNWIAAAWNKCGSYANMHCDLDDDLVNAPRTWWVNVYADGTALSYDRKTDADKQDEYDFLIGSRRIACVQVTEGDGLDEPEPDYVRVRHGEKVRAGDDVIADDERDGSRKRFTVKIIDVTENEILAVPALPNNPNEGFTVIKGDDATLIKSNHTGGDDV